MKLSIPLLVTLASVQVASAASVTVYSSTAIAGVDPSGYNVAQFDTSLGTLTGVEVSVPICTLTGSVLVTNPVEIPVVVNHFSSGYDVWGSSLSLGYTEQTPSIAGHAGVSTSPDWHTSLIDPNASLPFSITSGQSYTVNAENIASSYFSAYEGSGHVTFDIKNIFSITTTGASYTVSTAAAGANSQVEVTYTYTPALSAVPEPSTSLALGLLVMSGLSMRTRRRA